MANIHVVLQGSMMGEELVFLAPANACATRSCLCMYGDWNITCVHQYELLYVSLISV